MTNPAHSELKLMCSSACLGPRGLGLRACRYVRPTPPPDLLVPALADANGSFSEFRPHCLRVPVRNYAPWCCGHLAIVSCLGVDKRHAPHRCTMRGSADELVHLGQSTMSHSPGTTSNRPVVYGRRTTSTSSHVELCRLTINGQVNLATAIVQLCMLTRPPD